MDLLLWHNLGPFTMLQIGPVYYDSLDPFTMTLYGPFSCNAIFKPFYYDTILGPFAMTKFRPFAMICFSFGPFAMSAWTFCYVTVWTFCYDSLDLLLWHSLDLCYENCIYNWNVFFFHDMHIQGTTGRQ